MISPTPSTDRIRTHDLLMWAPARPLCYNLFFLSVMIWMRIFFCVGRPSNLCHLIQLFFSLSLFLLYFVLVLIENCCFWLLTLRGSLSTADAFAVLLCASFRMLPIKSESSLQTVPLNVLWVWPFTQTPQTTRPLCRKPLEWGSIRCKHNVRWKHLSQIKTGLF